MCLTCLARTARTSRWQRQEQKHPAAPNRKQHTAPASHMAHQLCASNDLSFDFCDSVILWICDSTILPRR